MFAYCGNNPVICIDTTGAFFFTLVGAAVGAAMGALSAVIEGKTGKEFTASVLSGATSGAIAGVAADVLLVTGGSAGVVALAMAGAGALGAVASNYVEATITDSSVNWSDTACDIFFDASFGALFGYMGGPIKSQISTFAKKGFFRAIEYIAAKELNNIASTVAEEILGNTTAGLGRFMCDYYYQSFLEEAFD